LNILRTIALAMVLMGMSATGYAQGSGLYGKGMRLELNAEGSKYIRFLTWAQVWARAQELNPGTTVAGNEEEWAGDFLIRRARFLTYGQLSDDVLILFHVGINNQNFRDFRADFYVHDAWVEYRILGDRDIFSLYVGGGLHYWNGISRMTNASTLNIMAIDTPISNWPTIEFTDQFARQLGLFIKGKVMKRFDYRMAVNRPFNRGDGSSLSPNDAGELPVGAIDRNGGANTFSAAGYYQLQLWDIEGNKLPYTVGTWLGSKKVLNIGFGFHHHKDATVTLIDDEDGDPTTAGRETHDLNIFGADVFLDLPFGEPSKSKTPALTAYLSYQYQGFGPRLVRNIGISNIGDPGSGAGSLNGRGNGYPSVGTGHHFYALAGFLIPLGVFGDEDALQPYADLHVSALDAYEDLGPTIGVGTNYLLHGHHAKVTAHYRARPIFIEDESRVGLLDTLASEFLLQLMLWF